MSTTNGEAMTAGVEARRYFGEWTKHAQVASDFAGFGAAGSPADIATDAEIVFATYDREDYEGAALVVFRRDGVLYEVNASHCSCYGLEDQWKPEETTWPAIGMRTTYGLSPEAEAALLALTAAAK